MQIYFENHFNVRIGCVFDTYSFGQYYNYVCERKNNGYVEQGALITLLVTNLQLCHSCSAHHCSEQISTSKSM